MNAIAAIAFVTLLSVARPGRAEENTVLLKARAALTSLKAECDVAGQTNVSLWLSYVSATEKARHEAIAQLRLLGGETVDEVRSELQRATGEYEEMLVIALASLGDRTAITDAAELMLRSDKPAVLVSAAWELRGLKDKRLTDHFKQAASRPIQAQGRKLCRDWRRHDLSGEGHSIRCAGRVRSPC